MEQQLSIKDSIHSMLEDWLQMLYSHAGAKQMDLTAFHDKTVGYEYPTLQVHQINLHPLWLKWKKHAKCFLWIMALLFKELSKERQVFMRVSNVNGKKIVLVSMKEI